MPTQKPLRLTDLKQAGELNEGDQIVQIEHPDELRFRPADGVLKALERFATKLTVIYGINDMFDECLGVDDPEQGFIPLAFVDESKHVVISGGGSNFTEWHVRPEPKVVKKFPEPSPAELRAKHERVPNLMHPAVSGRPNPFAVEAARLERTLKLHFAEWAETSEKLAVKKRAEKIDREIGLFVRKLFRNGVDIHADDDGVRFFLPPKFNLDANKLAEELTHVLGYAGVLDDQLAISELRSQTYKLFQDGVADATSDVLDHDTIPPLLEKVLKHLQQNDPEKAYYFNPYFLMFEQSVLNGAPCEIWISIIRESSKKRSSRFEFTLT